MNETDFQKCKALTDAIYFLKQERDTATAAKREKLTARIAKLRVKRAAILGLNRVSKL